MFIINLTNYHFAHRIHFQRFFSAKTSFNSCKTLERSKEHLPRFERLRAISIFLWQFEKKNYAGLRDLSSNLLADTSNWIY